MLAVIQNDIETTNDKRYILPVDYIEGVNVSIEITNNDMIFRSSEITNNEYNHKCLGMFQLVKGKNVQCRKFDRQSLTNMETLLDAVEFDKFAGKFVLGTKGDEERKCIVEKEYIVNLNKPKLKLKEKYGECCVCLENTTTKTECKHYVCIPCADKIKLFVCGECDGQDCCDDEDCGHKICPLCRAKLFIN